MTNLRLRDQSMKPKNHPIFFPRFHMQKKFLLLSYLVLPTKISVAPAQKNYLTKLCLWRIPESWTSGNNDDMMIFFVVVRDINNFSLYFLTCFAFWVL